jgi:hypothetical protein
MIPLNRPFLACASVASRRVNSWHLGVWGLLHLFFKKEKGAGQNHALLHQQSVNLINLDFMWNFQPFMMVINPFS